MNLGCCLAVGAGQVGDPGEAGGGGILAVAEVVGMQFREGTWVVSRSVRGSALGSATRTGSTPASMAWTCSLMSRSRSASCSWRRRAALLVGSGATLLGC